MKRTLFLLLVVPAVICGLGVDRTARAQSGAATYSVTDLGTLGAYPQATSLSNTGQVVGYSRLAASGPTHATLNIPGLGITDLGVLPGGFSSAAVKINDAGQVIGTATGAGGIGRGFLWTPAEGMRDIGSLAPNYFVSASTLNRSGQICGSAWAADTKYHAFLWNASDGIRDLGTLGGGWSYCHDLNDSGQAAGVSTTSEFSAFHAFRYEPGTNGAPGNMNDLGTLGGVESLAYGINSAGIVVGRSYVDNTVVKAFYDVPGSGITAINIGGPWSEAFLINDSGLIAGLHAIGSNWWEYQYHAFVYQIGSTTRPVDIGTLGGDYSSPAAINESGVVVGRSRNASRAWRAFIYRDGVMTDLNTLIPAGSGMTLVEAQDINDKGWILALGQLANGEYRPYLLKPGPFFDFNGFLAPVGNLPVVNSARAGISIPIKFSLGGDRGLGVVSSSTSVPTACDSTAPVDTIDETTSAGASTLAYDPATGIYKYSWKTEKSWTGCRYFLLTLSDGNTYSAKFKFDR